MQLGSEIILQKLSDMNADFAYKKGNNLGK
jgi:hypothetical protein